MDWESLYCPNRCCRYYGIPFRQGLLVKNGASRGQPQALCRACGTSVSVRYGTAYCELDAEPVIFETAVRALAEGNALRAAARIVQIDKDTACDWLRRAGQQCRLVMLYLWRKLHVTECQLDELWSFVHTKEDHLAWAKVYCATYGDAWVWLAFAPAWRVVLAFVVGKRTQEQANLLLERVVHVTDDHIPFFTSDQLAEYPVAHCSMRMGRGTSRHDRATAGVILTPAASPCQTYCTHRSSKNGNADMWWRSPPG